MVAKVQIVESLQSARISARAAAAKRADTRDELLARALLDFNLFCRLVDILPEKGGQRIPFVPNPIQIRYNAIRSPRDINLKSRRVGFTTLECIRDVWYFLTHRGATVLVVCQHERDYKTYNAICQTFRIIFESLARWGLNLKFGSKSGGKWTLPDRDSVLQLIQAAESETAAAKLVRGDKVNRLHCTEIAYFTYAYEIFMGLRSAVPPPETGSEVVLESTPKGAGGFFHDMWMGANETERSNGFQPCFFPWFEDPKCRRPVADGTIVRAVDETTERLFEALRARGVREDQLEWYRFTMAGSNNDRAYMEQEHASDPETCFLQSGRQFFDTLITQAMIYAAQSPIRSEMKGALRIFTLPEPGRKYVVSVDTAEGAGGAGTPIIPTGTAHDDSKADWSVATVFRRNGEHVASYRAMLPPWQLAAAVAQIAKFYNNAMIAVERNNHGAAVITALVHGQKVKSLLYVHMDGKFGWHTQSTSRPMMLDQLHEAHLSGLFKTKDAHALSEFRTFVINANGRPEAQRGSHDDFVMAMAIGWAVICQPESVQRDASAIAY